MWSLLNKIPYLLIYMSQTFERNKQGWDIFFVLPTYDKKKVYYIKDMKILTTETGLNINIMYNICQIYI